jgi:hypothetical protein
MKALFDQLTKKGARYHRFEMRESEYRELSDSLSGLCIYCATLADMADPDTRAAHCPDCGLAGVYGAEELLIRGLIEFTD